jgi:type I restriction enzyme S subunit
MGNEREFKDLPEGWKVVTINSIIKNALISGIWGEEPKDFENIYPILRSTEISHEGRIIIKNVTFRKVKLEPSKISKYVLRNGDILIVSSSGSEELIGRVAIFKYPGNEKFLFSNFLLRLRVGEKIDSTYMFYLLSSFWYRDFLSKFQETSTGLRNFPKNEFLNYFFLPLPPLPEQQKIAEILETVDNAIEKTDKIIEKYKRIKQGLMQDLLTKGIDENGNIRNEKTHKFKDSPLGRMPEEWEVSYVSNFTEINPITKINPKELYPFIEMDATPIMGKQYKYITLRRGIEAGSKFKKGDILLARITPSAENGKALLVPDNIEIGIGSTEFIVFRAKENIDNNFLFYLLISDYVRSIAIGLMEGTSGRQRIPKYVFEKVIKVGIPKSKSEQQRIAEILSQIDKTIEKEEQYKEKLKRLKQGLMEDLLTGKVRVNHLVEEEEK